MTCLFTVDVEDWFHIMDIPSAPALSEWDNLPSHVEKNFFRLLDLFDNKGVSVTCFFLGWVARRFPELVIEADRRGHEIASHGYSHQLIFQMTVDEFYEDVLKSKGILEDLIGRNIKGYRAPGFSANTQIPWFYEKLAEAGYVYSSSIFPAGRGHGGDKDANLAPHIVEGESGSIIEIPISVVRFFGKKFCFSGGGYLRLFPYPLIYWMTREVENEGRPVIVYIHPREIDPDHPRLKMSAKRQFKSYINLKTTEKKLRSMMDQFKFATTEQYIIDHCEDWYS